MSLELNKKELLYFLSSRPEITYEMAGDRLNLSKRSIKMIIESLLYSYSQIFSIEEQGERLSLVIHDQDQFQLLITEDLLHASDLTSFHKRQAVFFQQLLEADSYLSSDDLAEELGISRRSLSRDMQRMKDVLDSYGLRLASKTGVGIRLEGSELGKRLLYLYQVLDYLAEDEVDLPEEVLNTYTDFISNMQLPFDVQRTFLSTLIITWKRRDFVLDETDFIWFTRQSQLDLPSIFYEILEAFWERPITSLEKNFLTFPMQIGLISSDVERPDVLAMAEEVLAQTVEEFGMPLDVKESARLLQRHLVYMLNRSVIRWQFNEVGLREQLVRSSFSTVVSRFFLQEVSSRTGLTISEKEEILLAAWMELLLARKSKPLINKIAVISQAGQSFNYLVEKEMRKIFGQDVQIEFMEFTNHPPYQELEARFDLVFTDNLMHSQELFHSFLSLTLVTEENQAERERLERTVLGRRVLLNTTVLVTHFHQEQTYEENLASLLEKLVEKGLLSTVSRQKLLAKEADKPALSDEGFAFPHLTSDQLEQITLVVAEDETLNLASQTGIAVKDFVLLLIPTELDDFHQDLLYQIFDNTFRTRQGHLKKRLGIDNIDQLEKI